MGAVFPETMGRLDVNDPMGSLQKIETYIRYMTERMEFSTRNMNRSVSEAGVSSAQIYTMVKKLGNTVSALQSVINQLTGRVAAVNERLATVQGETAALENSLQAVRREIGTLRTNYSALAARVTELEQLSKGQGGADL